MSERMRIAVAGATGRAGRHTVDALRERGHEVVAMSRSSGVDIVTGEGLAQALEGGVDAVVDAATGPSPDREEATAFFTAASRNLQDAARRAGARRIVVVSIVGIDRAAFGYGAAKLAHERAMRAGPVPAVVLRAAQFHEFVEQLVDWGRQGDVAYVPLMRTQLVAARAVGEALADLAVDPVPTAPAAPTLEIAGPREERLAEMARLLIARRGDRVRVEEVSDPANPEHEAYASGALLPGPDATLAGPTFEAWLEAEVPVRAA
jgi:uncharacterized protein YbjT (DUF2867 family)